MLFFALTVVSNRIVTTVADVELLMPWINATVYFLYVIAGIVVAVVAKRRVIANGVIAGILAATTAILIFGVAGGELFGISVTVINGGVLGGIGGACTVIFTRKKRNTD